MADRRVGSGVDCACACICIIDGMLSGMERGFGRCVAFLHLLEVGEGRHSSCCSWLLWYQEELGQSGLWVFVELMTT